MIKISDQFISLHFWRNAGFVLRHLNWDFPFLTFIICLCTCKQLVIIVCRALDKSRRMERVFTVVRHVLYW